MTADGKCGRPGCVTCNGFAQAQRDREEREARLERERREAEKS